MPGYPGQIESIAHIRQWYSACVDWYNLQHHHSGLAGFTPEQVFNGRYRAIAEVCQQALDESVEAHYERFTRVGGDAASHCHCPDQSATAR